MRLDLSGEDMRGAQMRNAILIGAKLNGVDFRNANLIHSNFAGADVKEADPRGAVLEGADFSVGPSTSALQTSAQKGFCLNECIGLISLFEPSHDMHSRLK